MHATRSGNRRQCFALDNTTSTLCLFLPNLPEIDRRRRGEDDGVLCVERYVAPVLHSAVVANANDDVPVAVLSAELSKQTSRKRDKLRDVFRKDKKEPELFIEVRVGDVVHRTRSVQSQNLASVWDEELPL